MKRILTLLLAAGLTFGAALTTAHAIEFKAQGEWMIGLAAGEGNFVNKTRDAEGSHKADNEDKFAASQRVRLQLDAVASENLSGTVFFELSGGDDDFQTWGKSEHGGAVGADGRVVKVKNAYLDWTVPDTTLKFRMGIQGIALPNAAGGSAVLDDDVAGITASCDFNDNFGLTFTWARPYNDNYSANDPRLRGSDKNNFLDNMDLFALALPIKFEGIEVTPWVMYGVVGKNTFMEDGALSADWSNSGYQGAGWRHSNDENSDSFHQRSTAYGDAFWAGLPVKLSLWDPLNIEFDINYGSVASQGRGDIYRADRADVTKRYDTKREGWLVKALVEYKMDWGTPGIFGWYASGDDDNPKNGSERMPSVSPSGNFTSFLGDGNQSWAASGAFYDRNLSYAGTWGIGLQVADMSFLEDLSHTFRVALWGGTNSPTMAKYAAHPYSWNSGDDGVAGDELYLTTNDYLLEFNLVNSYKIYENLEINFELGYIVNMVDNDTWKKANRTESFDKQDAWKAQLNFAYTF